MYSFKNTMFFIILFGTVLNKVFASNDTMDNAIKRCIAEKYRLKESPYYLHAQQQINDVINNSK